MSIEGNIYWVPITEKIQYIFNIGLAEEIDLNGLIGIDNFKKISHQNAVNQYRGYLNLYIDKYINSD